MSAPHLCSHVNLAMVIIHMCTWSDLIVMHDVFLVSILKYKLCHIKTTQLQVF